MANMSVEITPIPTKILAAPSVRRNTKKVRCLGSRRKKSDAQKFTAAICSEIDAS